LSAIYIPKVRESPYAPLLLAIGVTNIFILLSSLFFIRKVVFDTIRWYRDRYTVLKNSDNSTPDENSAAHKKEQEEYFVYKNLIPGRGEGTVKLGQTIELNENVYAILFVSLFK